MKKLTTNLLRGRMTRWSMLAVVLAGAGLSLAWIYPMQYKLGGGWIGASPGFVWNALQIPLDPAARTAAIQVHNLTYPTAMAELLAPLGADTLTEFTGEVAMINTDTAKWTLVGYGQKQGNPPEIREILVCAGTLKFTGRDSWEINYTMTAYPATADADGDGFPDPDAEPFVVVPGLTGACKRVPLP